MTPIVGSPTLKAAMIDAFGAESVRAHLAGEVALARVVDDMLCDLQAGPVVVHIRAREPGDDRLRL